MTRIVLQMAMGFQKPRGRYCLMLAVNTVNKKPYESFRTFVGKTPTLEEDFIDGKETKLLCI